MRNQAITPYRRTSNVARYANTSNHSRRVNICFEVPYRCNFGQHLAVVGTPSSLGAWEPSMGLTMEWSEGDVWRAIVEVDVADAEERFEYKYVVRDSNGAVAFWKPGPNYTFDVESMEDLGDRLLLSDTWDGVHDIVVYDEAEAARRQSSQYSEGSGSTAGSADAYGHHRDGNGAAEDAQEQAFESTSSQLVDRAFQELDDVISLASDLTEVMDGADPRILAADQMVASSAHRALALMKALQAPPAPRIDYLKEADR